MGANNVRHSKYHYNVFSPSTQPLSQTAVVAPTDQPSTILHLSSHPPLPLQYHRSISLISHIVWYFTCCWILTTSIGLITKDLQSRKKCFKKVFVFLCSRLSNYLVWSGFSLKSKLKTQKSYIKSPDKACTEAIPPRLKSSIITPLPGVLPFWFEFDNWWLVSAWEAKTVRGRAHYVIPWIFGYYIRDIISIEMPKNNIFFSC